MSEAEFAEFHHVISIIEVLSYAACFTIFYYPFMAESRERDGNRYKKDCVVFVIYSAVYLVDVYGWMRMMIAIALIGAAARFLDIDRVFSFLLGVWCFSIRYLSVMIMHSADYVLSRYLLRDKSELEEVLKISIVEYTIVAFAQIILCCILLYLAGRCLQRRKWQLNIRELCYLALIPITGILFGNINIRLWIVVMGNEIFRLYEQYPAFLWIVPLIAVLFYLGMIGTITSYQQMTALQEERKKYFIEEQQIHAIQERIEEVEQFYRGIRQLRHEMRNHLTNIKGLAVGGKYEDMEQYIARMDESISAYELTVSTGNAVTDVIVGDRKKDADRLGIEFQTEFFYPTSDQYDAYDIGIILNNLLTNALEACEKISEKEERCIMLSGRQKRKFFLIEVKNTFEGEITFDTDTKLPVSTKQTDAFRSFDSFHGMGLSNVKREVEKYMGDMKIRVKKNEFIVTVLLQERRAENECR